MAVNVCHVSVHADDDVGVVDLTLPARLPVASLLPDIVRLAGADTQPGGRWRLATVGGTVLDESVPLRDQDIRDGDLLLLTPEPPRAPRFDRADPVTAVLAAALPPGDTRALRATAGLIAGSAGAAAAAARPGSASLATAGVLLGVAAAAAYTASRSGRDPAVRGPLGCLAVLMAAVCGALAVPGPLATPHALLGASAAATASLVLLHLGVGSAVASAASACGAVLCAAALTVVVVWALPWHSAGVLLSLLALGALSVAPRLSVLASGLAPAPALTAEPLEDADRRATAGHRILGAIVIGVCAVAAVGTAVVAVGCLDGFGHRLSGAGFCAAVGAALLLRARCYAAGRCRWALMLSGSCSLAMVLMAMAGRYGHWAAAVAFCAGVIVIARDRIEDPSPVASRAVEVFEYLALAAVIPAACAALDVFALVRTSSPI